MVFPPKAADDQWIRPRIILPGLLQKKGREILQPLWPIAEKKKSAAPSSAIWVLRWV
jgi:hypothetical protein